MLTLSRRKNESIDLSGGIRITVVHLDRGKVRLGISAPPNVKVLRTELLSKGQGERHAEGGEDETSGEASGGDDGEGPD